MCIGDKINKSSFNELTTQHTHTHTHQKITTPLTFTLLKTNDLKTY